MDAFDLAERIKLLPPPRTQEEASILALTFGALYTEALAEKFGYTVRKSYGATSLVQEIVRLVDIMVRNRVVPIGPTQLEENFWLAGIYFKDALARTDIAFEWTARYVVGINQKDYGPPEKDLKEQVRKAGFPGISLVSWSAIGDEVNRFKHRNQFE